MCIFSVSKRLQSKARFALGKFDSEEEMFLAKCLFRGLSKEILRDFSRHLAGDFRGEQLFKTVRAAPEQRKSLKIAFHACRITA